MADAPVSESAPSLDTHCRESIHEESRQLGQLLHQKPTDAMGVKVQVNDIGRLGENCMQMRKLGIMFKNMRVVGLGTSAAVQHNVLSLFYPQSIISYIHTLRHPPLRDIISDFDGVVLPGEMLLVLGRPGSGCSTFLKTLANHRGGYHAVLGDVFYDSFTSDEIDKLYRGDVTYCPEDDVHFPTLTVAETLEFASRMRTPSREGDDKSRTTRATNVAEQLMHTFGLEHVRNTVIGNESIRGISGGEKKRVSLAEVMSARGQLVCWDNPTRGLDSSTALEFIQVLRAMTDAPKVTTVVSIYQAGEQLFQLFDKVCLIYDGRMAYFGPAKEAKQYFMDMGYEPRNRQMTSDFLVAVTDPNARMIRSGFTNVVPRTADEMAAYFKASSYGQLNRSSMDSYYELYVEKPDLKIAYEASAARERAWHVPNNQAYILSIPMQVQAVMRRHRRRLKGDRISQALRIGIQIFQAIFIGSVFPKISDDTSAYFSRGSMLYLYGSFAIAIVIGLNGLFFQRLIFRRHQKAALYHPFIDALALTIIEIPITLISVAIMSVILYFFVGLQNTAKQFCTFLLFLFIVTVVMTTCFRSIAAFSNSEWAALSGAGFVLVLLILYTGFAIPTRNIVGALRWISYLNPLRYAFEPLMVNAFHAVDGTCTTLVPSGPGYVDAVLTNQVCTTPGSQPGMATVSGEAYVYVWFGYSYSNLWKGSDLGVLCIFGFGFLGILLFFTQYNTQTAWDPTTTLYKEESNRRLVHQATDEERHVPDEVHNSCDGPVDSSSNSVTETLQPRGSKIEDEVLSWKSIEYEVPVSGGEMRILLDGVTGYVSPGKLTALMGESGAGKTTLLNVLAQHVSAGVVRGECFVNGQPLHEDFQAKTAYAQQNDVHIPESTVREALMFSARLRRPSSIPMAEKEAHVNECLKMCGLESYSDAIVGSLSIEYKKRVTIAVELAAKQNLLFLDEPTSGLDSQSAWAIVTCLRKLANNGQAILCTIHQPSGELFQLFEKLLLLRKGGQTVYFGNIGERSTTIIHYFERNGGPKCGEDANPAEYILSTIGAGATATCPIDWNRIWKESPEAAELERKIECIRQERRSHPLAVSTRTRSEFARSWIKQLVFCVASGLVVGVTFFGANNSLQGCQAKLFSVLIATGLSVPMTYQLQGKFLESRNVYEVRERPLRMFTWPAFLVSQILIEIPWQILGSTLFFFCWYWTSGFESSRAGFSYLFYCVVLPLYCITLGLALAAISSTAVTATTLLSASFSFTAVFGGVLQPYSSLGWWRWMYHVSPFKYVINGVLGQALGRQQITCAPTELVTIEPPSQMSCGAYMDHYISTAGGYLTNPDATTQCTFCPYETTDQFLRLNFNVSYGKHWRDLGAVLGFVGINVLFMFAGMYFFRIRKGEGNPLGWFKRRS